MHIHSLKHNSAMWSLSCKKLLVAYERLSLECSMCCVPSGQYNITSSFFIMILNVFFFFILSSSNEFVQLVQPTCSANSVQPTRSANSVLARAHNNDDLSLHHMVLYGAHRKSIHASITKHARIMANEHA